jgi:4,5-DOPA dioxygenase extradiol
VRPPLRSPDARSGENADALGRFDVDALLDFRDRAPAVETALPTWEHYAPVLVAAGVASLSAPSVSFPFTGFWQGGAFTRRSVQLA